jgi:cytochrome c556
MRLYKTAIFAGAILAGAAASVSVSAHSGATGIVGERMDHMKMLSDAVKQLTAMFTGKAPYNAAKVRDLANVVKDHGGATMTALFPKGSIEPPSEAKSEIWTDWQTFQALADQLESFGAGLAAAADNPRGGMPGGAGLMGQQGGMMGQSGQGMMGRNMMGSGGSPGVMPQHSAETFAQMPPDMVFGMVTQTCSSCHTRFRAEKN